MENGIDSPAHLDEPAQAGSRRGHRSTKLLLFAAMAPLPAEKEGHNPRGKEQSAPTSLANPLQDSPYHGCGDSEIRGM